MRHQQIVVGIVRDQSRTGVLVCQRRADQTQPGKWEFPGGKLDPGESPLQALCRELDEEINIHVEAAHPLVRIDHDYPEGSVRLHVWVVDRWTGEIRAMEGQQYRWVSTAGLEQLMMPAANRRIIRAYQLGPLYLITPDRSSYDEHFLSATDQLLAGGVRLVQFRSTQSSFVQHHAIVRELVAICNQYGCRLIYNGTIEQADKVGAHGVHLNSMRLLHTTDRVSDDWLVSASCHDMEQLRQASLLQLDFCVLGPVHPSTSHPGREGMGWHRFAEIAAESLIPVYALGGLAPDDLGQARLSGAHGIAMISGVWNATDPVAACRLAD